MKTVLFSGIAAAGMLFAVTGADASDSWSHENAVSVQGSMGLVANGRKVGATHHIGTGNGLPKPGIHRIGFRPGQHGIPRNDIYRRPHRGLMLPRFWVQPTFYVSNYRSYGLIAPSNGYYWTRYYDDAVLTDSRGYVHDYRSGIDWNAGHEPRSEYRDPEYAPAMRPDAQAYSWNDDGNVSFAAPDGSSYSYDGEWDGRYVDPEGRVFEGDWSGTVTRQDGHSGTSDPANQRHDGAEEHDHKRRYEDYERCLKSSGLKGAAIGALIGGVAGNRIAGRGDRTGGTLVGAGVGGLLGVAVEKANDKCKHHRPGNSRPPVGHSRPYSHPDYGQAWQGGYYYYPQPAQVTTIITMAPVTTTTTTVTEQVYYDTVRVAPRKKVVRKWKPKPRCTCR